MVHRAKMPAHERSARSRLAKLLHESPLLCGTIIQMSRTCGKDGCKCARGEKHVSGYLSIRLDDKRKMVYVPPELEDAVRERVDAYREAKALINEVSRMCLDAFLKEKEKLGEAKREKRSRKQGKRDSHDK